ncbi:ChuX/HutX family heme-like substrate-binding protein [Paraglaciecola chathamensis]|uniref:ChuX/HutX family heme-like substrate-binding protein n=1 Tax=Paraglaciecola chathamensis TaxID=368405 RepID=UPI0026FCB449|nr:ChuX/HutX family heme-like substrate-binding protein [Paraglaciecola chathamensis]MDO6558498.1 ChuX/HutX family heme-like substrate-binding protein [Paraglaciecola chathamensis]
MNNSNMETNSQSVGSNNEEKNQLLMHDPDALHEAIAALTSANPHMHPPQIALHLGVPEASLAACAISGEPQSGAMRLKPKVNEILSTINGWGSVLCVFANEGGVFMPLGNVVLTDVTDTHLALKGEHLTAQIASQAISDVYLVIQQDKMHGNTRSLQFFDENGAMVLKVFIFHKVKFREAQKIFLALRSEDQRRTFIPFATQNQGECASNHIDSFRGGSVEAVSGFDKSHAAELSRDETVDDAFKEGENAVINWHSQFAHARWSGSFDKLTSDENMLHIHSKTLRAHLRFNGFQYWVKAGQQGYQAFGKRDLLLEVSTNTTPLEATQKREVKKQLSNSQGGIENEE